VSQIDWNLSPEKQDRKKELLSQEIQSIDLENIKTIADLMKSFEGASIQARNLNNCAQTLEGMLQDEERPTIFLGLSGALIAGGLRKVLRDMIKYNMIDVIVSTGAIIYQDIYQAKGNKHYKGSPASDDKELRDLFIDRIYDTYVDEVKFWECDTWIGNFADTLEPRNYSSREFLSLLGNQIEDENSILYTANKYGVPVFCPALNDSSIGIGLTDHYHRNRIENKPHISIDSIRDNYELTQIVVKSNRTSAIYIGGGVPKNYINDSIVMSYIFNEDTGGHKYALQITTANPSDGGLSGSTLSEATSWGKVSKKATHAMAFVESTIALSLLVGYVMQEKLSSKRSRQELKWNHDILESLNFKEVATL
jgi:deoxyhypusine synthase